MRDPCLRFIGVASTESPERLLGLTGRRASRAEIEQALAARLERIYRHPARGSAEAEAARAILRRSADAMIARLASVGAGAPFVRAGAAGRASAPDGSTASRRRVLTPRQHRLTAFDRHVLAVLVGRGGWNRRSRGRLVALAASYGVGPDGLVRVLRGLNDNARSGGPRIGLGEITGAPDGIEPPGLTERLGEATRRMVPEIVQGDPWSLAKLAILIVLLVAMLALVLIRAMVVERPGDSVDGGARVHGDAAGGRDGRDGAAATPMLDAGRDGSAGPAIARFRPYPTFRGTTLPPHRDRVDEGARAILAELGGIAEALAMADEGETAVFERWTRTIELAARDWMHQGESDARDIMRAVHRCFSEAAGRPEIARRLFLPVAPPSGLLLDPGDVARGAWLAGVLGDLSMSSTLTPLIRDLARGQLAVSLPPGGTMPQPGFLPAAAAWSDAAVQWMVPRIVTDERYADAWETWLAVQRRLPDDARRQVAGLRAIERILVSPLDASRDGPPARVLGRLLSSLDYRASRPVRAQILRWLEGGEERIGSQQLWVLTSLLAQADFVPWFDLSFVVAPDATLAQRNRVHARVAATWPEIPEPAAPVRIRRFDEDALATWHGLRAALEARSADTGDVARMESLVLASLLAEAGWAILTDEPATADAALEQAATLLVAPPAGPRAGSGRPLRVPSTDNQLEPRLRQARTTEERIDVLEAIRQGRWTDLAPGDARTLAGLVVAGATPLRAAARSLVQADLADGTNVLIAIVDALPQVRGRDDDLADLISVLTSRPVPVGRGRSWMVAARGELVQRVLRRLDAGMDRLDEMGLELATTFIRRAMQLRTDAALAGERDRLLRASDPVVAAGAMADAWIRRAEETLDPADASLVAWGRRARLRAAATPLQHMAAEQITGFDVLGRIAVASLPPDDRPAFRDRLAALRRRHAAADEIIVQSRMIEESLLGILAVLFEAQEDTP